VPAGADDDHVVALARLGRGPGAVPLALGVVGYLAAALRANRAAAAPGAAYDLQVYRDQLKELDRDVERGVLGEAEAERARLEVSRRLLDADRALARAGRGSTAPAQANLWVTVAFGGVILVGGFATYWFIGAPGYPDMPFGPRIAAMEAERAQRPSQAAWLADMPDDPDPGLMPPGADASYPELMADLRATVAETGDPEGLALLARNEASLGRFRAASAAQARLIDAKGAAATARDHAMLAWLLVAAAGGYVAPEAEQAAEQALLIDPQQPLARHITAVMYAQAGRFDLTFALWQPLLENSPPGAPWVADIRGSIEAVAQQAGIDYSLPPAPGAPALRGPTAADMEAAQSMRAEDRQAMIEGMVEGLAERLATEGGTPAEWAQLIGALANLGQTERAEAILTEARQVFADTPGALDPIEAAAQQAGIAR
jgi:cytochrome c-type biogenesis protein CcmH